MKLLVCFGTRPEAIEMGSLVHKLKQSTVFEVKLCVTAQHRQMLDQVLDFFELTSDYDLDIMEENESLSALSGRIFLKIDEILQDFSPDIVLVHGDRTTSSVCAWATFNRDIKVAHIEAGLRTFNKFPAFPEELNRQLTSRISDYHFVPTKQSAQYLLDENIAYENILPTGNTVIDSLFWTVEKLGKGFSNSKINELKSLINFDKKIIFVKGHRRENFSEGFLNICKALKYLAENNNVEIVYPVHLNPQVQKPVMEMLSGVSNIRLISPLDYPSFLWLMTKSYLIITDSGGIQEEAPSLGKPVFALRETTERAEAVNHGSVKLVGTNTDKIIETIQNLLNNSAEYEKMSRAHNPYGDGNACSKIVNFFENI